MHKECHQGGHGALWLADRVIADVQQVEDAPFLQWGEQRCSSQSRDLTVIEIQILHRARLLRQRFSQFHHTFVADRILRQMQRLDRGGGKRLCQNCYARPGDFILANVEVG